jgi:hypothetical protein
MGAKYHIYEFEFDVEAWAQALENKLSGKDVDFYANVVGCSPSILRQWTRGQVNEKFPHPSMNLFLSVCNELDLDPRQFFKLKDA